MSTFSHRVMRERSVYLPTVRSNPYRFVSAIVFNRRPDMRVSVRESGRPKNRDTADNFNLSLCFVGAALSTRLWQIVYPSERQTARRFGFDLEALEHSGV